MMIATCNGTVRSDPSVAGAAALDIIQIPGPVPNLDLAITQISRFQSLDPTVSASSR
jgi:hypothetical protein